MDLRIAAMNLLAPAAATSTTREAKLVRKLNPDKEQLETVLDKLVDDSLLSDQRFGEAFVRWRSGKGQGPVRIRVQWSVATFSNDNVLSACDVDWFTLAEEVAIKRFGETPAPDQKEKARRMRFLQYRGFSGEHVRAVLN